MFGKRGLYSKIAHFLLEFETQALFSYYQSLYNNLSDLISNSPPKTRFVSHLPDLMTQEDYLSSSDDKKIRVRININDQGVDVLGDSMYAHLVEELMAGLGADEIERMLCG